MNKNAYPIPTFANNDDYKLDRGQAATAVLPPYRDDSGYYKRVLFVAQPANEVGVGPTVMVNFVSDVETRALFGKELLGIITDTSIKLYVYLIGDGSGDFSVNPRAYTMDGKLITLKELSND